MGIFDHFGAILLQCLASEKPKLQKRNFNVIQS